jgi:hypothetical protein
MWVIFALLDPDPDQDCESGSGYESKDPVESGFGSGSTARLKTQLLPEVTNSHGCAGDCEHGAQQHEFLYSVLYVVIFMCK